MRREGGQKVVGMETKKKTKSETIHEHFVNGLFTVWIVDFTRRFCDFCFCLLQYHMVD